MTNEDKKSIKRRFKIFLKNGGRETLVIAMARAQDTADEFARSTRVDYRTLREPIGSAAEISIAPLPNRPATLIPTTCPYPGYKGAPCS